MLADARIGTTGFAYREWVGTVYPRGAAPGQLLALYAERLSAVEIVSTATRLPSPDLLSSWAASVPAAFQFALKAPGRVSQELAAGRNAARTMALFLEVVERLGENLGPIVIDVPRRLEADRRALATFLSQMPGGVRLAFDFGHPSWRDDATLRVLSAHEAALVLTDDGAGAPPLTVTAGFTYLRIRRDDDRPEAIDQWAERLGLLARRGIDVYAFLKHDRRGAAVDRAMRLGSLLRTESQYGEQAMLS
jgi:uncharacterized protein YecE (DUF72 family)